MSVPNFVAKVLVSPNSLKYYTISVQHSVPICLVDVGIFHRVRVKFKLLVTVVQIRGLPKSVGATDIGIDDAIETMF